MQGDPQLRRAGLTYCKVLTHLEGQLVHYKHSAFGPWYFILTYTVV